MRILLAPDSFKDSLGAGDAAAAMARGVAAVDPSIQVDLCPIADGGEGTLDALAAALQGADLRSATVTGPLSTPVVARWLFVPETADRPATAVVELAQAAGLQLVPAEARNPLQTTTRGVGTLIRHALDAGVAEVLLTLGGSATSDGGAGCAQALGHRFTMATGRVMHRPLTGGDLENLAAIAAGSVDPRLARARVRVACDVTNPLCGLRGAAAVYGPQKGADPAAVARLERGLATLASLRPDVDADTPGAGAAGGMGFGALAFLGGALEPGIDLVLERVGFTGRAAAADLVLTGEGRFDAQSLSGKAVMGVAHAAGDTPVVALVGCADHALLASPPPPLHAVHLIAPGATPADSIANAAAHLERATATLVAAYTAP